MCKISEKSDVGIFRYRVTGARTDECDSLGHRDASRPKSNTNQIIHHFISLFLKEIIIHGQKMQKKKNGKNGQFSLILTYVTPWKGVFKGPRIIENVENTIKINLTNH